MSSEAKAGAVVLFVVALALVAWGKLGGLLALKGTYDVVVCFDDLLGLPEGAKVRLNGVDIGEVAEVGVERRSEFPDKLAYAVLEIENDKTLYYGDTFQVASGTLLGDRHIKVTRDPSKPTDANEAISREAVEVLAGSPPGGIDAFTSRAESIADQADHAMSSLDAMLSDEQLQRDLKETFASLSVLARNASAIAGKTLELVDELGPEDSAKVKDLVDNLYAVSESLRRTAAGVNAMVATTTLPEDMEEITGNLAEASESVKGTVAVVEGIIGDPKTESDIRATLENVRAATAEATVTMAEATSVLQHVDNVVGRVDDATAGISGIGSGLKKMDVEGYADARLGSGPAGRIDVGVDLYPDRYKDEFWRVGVRDLGGDGGKLDLQRGFPLEHRGERLRVGVIEGELGVGWDRQWSPRLSTEAELIDPDRFRVDIKGKYRYDPDWDLLFGVDRALSGTEPFVGARRHFDF